MLPEEQELNRLEHEQAALADQVASDELTLETIKAESVQFQHYYYRTIGKLYVKFDELYAKITRADAGLAPDNIEARAQAEAAAQLAKKSAQEAGLVEKLSVPPLKITPELKQVFKQAARLMHPDRATNDAERLRRTISMTQVNVAYAKGDQATIERLMIEFGEDPEAITGEDVAWRLVKVIRRIAQLRRRLTEAQQEIASQKAGELYELMITITEAEEMGSDPLGDLAQQITRQISGLELELEMVRQTGVSGINWYE